MPRLSNVTLKAMALTKDPATRRPFHAIKSASGVKSMSEGHATGEQEPILAEPSAEVLKALSQVQLTKSAGDKDAEAAAEAIGRVLAVTKGLTAEDLLAVAAATGLAPLAKTSGAEADEDEDEDDLDDAEDEDEDTHDKKGNFKKGNPWAKDMKKSAAENKLEDVLKSADAVEIRKAVAEMRKSYEARIEKAEKGLAEERDHRMAGIVKSEMQAAFKNLGVDHGKLASIVKHVREAGQKGHADELMTILKAADAQVALAQKAGGNAYASVGKSTAFEGSGSSAMDRINQHVDAIVQKGEVKKTRPQLVDEFLATAEGQALWIEHHNEKRA